MHPSWHEIGRGYVLQIHVGGFQTPDCMIDEYPADCQRDKLFWRCRRFDVKRAHVKLKRMHVVLYVALERGKVILVWVVVSRLISSIMATGVVKVHKTTRLQWRLTWKVLTSTPCLTPCYRDKFKQPTQVYFSKSTAFHEERSAKLIVLLPFNTVTTKNLGSRERGVAFS